jgi:hypothetical protein
MFAGIFTYIDHGTDAMSSSTPALERRDVEGGEVTSANRRLGRGFERDND